MPEEIDCVGTKLTFVWMNDKTVVFEPLEEYPKMPSMFFESRASYEYVVEVHENEIEPSANDVHESLKCLCRILETEGHPKELKQTKKSEECRLLTILGIHWYLMIAFDEVYL